MSNYSEVIHQLKQKLEDVVKQSKKKDIVIFDKDIGLSYYKEQIASLKGQIEYYKKKQAELEVPAFNFTSFMKEINAEYQAEHNFTDDQIKRSTERYVLEYENIKAKKYSN